MKHKKVYGGIFLLMVFFQVIFIAVTFFEGLKNVALLLFLSFSIAFLTLGYFHLLREKSFHKNNILSKYYLFLGNIIGAVATYYIGLELGLGKVVSAGLVGSLGALIPILTHNKRHEELSGAIYCGAFVGMSSSLILDNLFLVSVAGLLSGIVYVASKNVLNGIGGKMGTIAFISVATTMFFKSYILAFITSL